MTDKQKNIARAKSIEQKNKERILALRPDIPDTSGIYIFTRVEIEKGIRYAYIGQAQKMLTRCAQHLSGFQHIDLSIKKHGLFDVLNNPTGWALEWVDFPPNKLDEQEQFFIRQYASGYQLYNHTTGGQSNGKHVLGEAKSPKGYRDGVAYGKKVVTKEIAHLFDLHLKAVYKVDKPSKNAIKALQKFNSLLQGDDEK